MKKILFSIATLAVAFGFTACSNEDETLSVKGEKTTVVAMTEAGTRTALADDGENAYNVVWSEGDQITIGDQTFTLNSGAGSTTASFTGTAPADGTYKAYYGINKNLDFGPTQYYEAGKVSNFPMYADAEVADGKIEPLQFKNCCGILSLTVKGTATIKSIKITAKENVSGILEFYPLLVSFSEGNPYLVLDCGTGIALTEEGTVFNIAMIERTYTGVQITLTDTENNSCTKTFKGTDGLVIERSKITKAAFSATTFVGTTGTAKAKINGVETDVKWIQLWEGGPKFAEYNVGVTDGKAESYGGYYCWGGTYNNNPALEGFKWTDDHNSNDAVLTGDTDTATKLWGSNWRMPTYYEFEALLNSNNCTCTWTTNYNETGINGLLCQGKEDTAYESNSVFLPAASICESGEVQAPGKNGIYVSTAFVMNGMWGMLFHASGRSMNTYYNRSKYAFTIRPVLAK